MKTLSYTKQKSKKQQDFDTSLKKLGIHKLSVLLNTKNKKSA